MAKRFLTIIVSVLLVLSIAFSLKETCSAANYSGAYRTNQQILLYVPYGMIGTTCDQISVYGQDYSSFVGYLCIPQGETFVAGADGYITVYGAYGARYLLFAPDWVRIGKMTKLY